MWGILLSKRNHCQAGFHNASTVCTLQCIIILHASYSSNHHNHHMVLWFHCQGGICTTPPPQNITNTILDKNTQHPPCFLQVSWGSTSSLNQQQGPSSPSKSKMPQSWVGGFCNSNDNHDILTSKSWIIEFDIDLKPQNPRRDF